MFFGPNLKFYRLRQGSVHWTYGGTEPKATDRGIARKPDSCAVCRSGPWNLRYRGNLQIAVSVSKWGGFQPLAPSLQPSNGKIGLEELAHQVRSFVDEQIPRGESFDLIGFSMGGLVSRYYAQRLGGIERIRRFITISSPNHGSRWAHLVANEACRQMRPGSAFLKDLNRDIQILEQVRFASLWTPMDLMIVPAISSRLEVGEEFVLPVAMHRWMVKNRRSLELVARLLQ